MSTIKYFSVICLILFLSLLITHCTCDKTKIQIVENGAELSLGKLNVKILFYSQSCVRITKSVPNHLPERASLSVIQTILPKIQLITNETPDSLFLKTDSLLLAISKKTGNCVFRLPEGQILLKEQSQPEFIPVVFDSDSGFTVRQEFKLSPNEGIYGLGQHQNGCFNYRSKEVKLVQSNTEAVNPFLISTLNYGILWDNYSKTIFSDKPTDASLESEMGNSIDYYFMCGTTMDEVIHGYRTLTGKAPMYGKWAYGYWQSKEHYDTQEELMTVARKYRKLKIPIDNMIQDWDYWNGAENWSGMFFDKTLFPNPKAMCNELHEQNFHIIISIWAALGPKTPIYHDMEAHRFLYKPVGWAGFKYYDAFNPEANRLYWKYLKTGIYSQGLDGWWIDSTEPDVVNALSKEATEYELKKMGSNYLGSWARYLNAFSLVMTNDMYKFWREETPEHRLFILTRSTYAGQQRNAATTWSGDIGANWEVYRNQISAGLNHSMSGIPYWTFDIGAFVLGSYEGVFCYGGKDPAYQELYTRMFQLGAFSPIFRSHGSETPREIWEFGEFTESLIRFDNLRYRLMPYIYSQAWKITSQDYTLMRGLPMDFPQDTNTYSVDDQFMFGPSMMVCPVTDYMYYTPPQKSVVIPAENFKNEAGKPGLTACYYKDAAYKNIGKETIDANIDINWYGGRPDYVTDSAFSIRWQGNLIPTETGKHQFHLKSFDKKRIILNGDTLNMVYTSTEQYSEMVMLDANKTYSIIVEVENSSTGAARMILNWKTPGIFAKEAEKAQKEKNRSVYLPEKTTWFDFWTGKRYAGGQSLLFDAPKNQIPLLIPAGTILPMGPLVEYAAQKPGAPIEIRIYPGKDGSFVLYEDENDNYNYEKGLYSEIPFSWDDQQKQLTIGNRKGSFPGMIASRVFNIVVVTEKNGIGVEPETNFNRVINYNGAQQVVDL